jgi:hypothetical protein
MLSAKTLDFPLEILTPRKNRFSFGIIIHVLRKTHVKPTARKPLDRKQIGSQ